MNQSTPTFSVTQSTPTMNKKPDLIWSIPTDVPHDYRRNDLGEWIFEAVYRGVRISCGYNECGPVAWVGHPTEDRWIDSVACNGSFESAAARAVALADEMFANDNWRTQLGINAATV